MSKKLDLIKGGFVSNLGKTNPRAKGDWCVADLGAALATRLNGNEADVALSFPDADIVASFDDSDAAYEYVEENSKIINVTVSRRYRSMIVFFNEHA